MLLWMGLSVYERLAAATAGVPVGEAVPLSVLGTSGDLSAAVAAVGRPVSELSVEQARLREVSELEAHRVIEVSRRAARAARKAANKAAWARGDREGFPWNTPWKVSAKAARAGLDFGYVTFEEVENHA